MLDEGVWAEVKALNEIKRRPIGLGVSRLLVAIAGAWLLFFFVVVTNLRLLAGFAHDFEGRYVALVIA